MLQTEDRRQWVAIDLLPKNIRDCLAGTQDDFAQSFGRDGDAPANKAGAKIMAWVRQSKRGFDVRILRRKPRSGRDEYTDLSVERDSELGTSEAGRTLFEMHADDIVHEICETGARHELPVAPPGYSASPDHESWHQHAEALTELHGDSMTADSPVPDIADAANAALVRPQVMRRMSYETGDTDTLQVARAQEEGERPKLHVETGPRPTESQRVDLTDPASRECSDITASDTTHEEDSISRIVDSDLPGKAIGKVKADAATTSHVATWQLSATPTPTRAHRTDIAKARPISIHGSDSGYHSESGSTYHTDSSFGSLRSSRPTALRSTSSGLKTVDEAAESSTHHAVSGTADEEVPQSTQSVESMEVIIKLALAKLLQEQAPASSVGAASDSFVNQGLRELKIAEATRFETDTDVDPPSPSDRKVPRMHIRPKIGLRSYQRKRGTAKNKPADRRQFLIEGADSDSSALERRLTMPKTLDASAGPEEAWKVLLASQRLILGPEHTLVLKAKLKRNESRDAQYKGCAPDLLQPLHETEATAVSFFEKSHPKVVAFSANLKALHALLSSQQSIVFEPQQETASDTQDSTESRVSPPVLEHAIPDTSIARAEDSTSAPHVEQSPTRSDSPTELSELRFPPGFRPATGDSPVSTIDPRTLLTAGNIWNSDRPPHEPKNDLLVLSGLALEAMTKASLNFMLWLRSTYGPEPEVEPGKVRVRWTCSCGQQLYDDFVESRTGAARQLERYLNRSRAYATQHPDSPSTPSSYQPSQNSSFGVPPSSQSSLNSVTPPPRSHHPGLYGRSPTLGSLPGYSPYNGMNYEARFLLTCANEDRFTPKVTHLNVQPNIVLNDRHLAQKLREHYAYVNRHWWKRLMKLRGLATIEFVQFEIHKNRFADIRKCPDMPDRGTKDYTFEPDDLLPPVGSTYLLHLFQHPEDYEHENLTYVRVPKKNGPLDTGKGWGINLCEGFPAERVLVFMLIGFSLASLVFAIAWFCKEKHDIQGAFSVAQWICTIGALCCKFSLQIFIMPLQLMT